MGNRDVCERGMGAGGSFLINKPGVSKINTLLEPGCGVGAAAGFGGC